MMNTDDRFEISRPGTFAGLVVSARSRRRFSRHYHDEYGFGLMVAGGHVSASGRGQVEAGTGDVITVNPGEVHDGEPVGDARRWWMIYLEPRAVEGAWRDCEEAGDCEFQHPASSDPAAARLLHELLGRSAGSGDADTLRCEEILLLLVRRLGQSRGERRPSGARPARLADAQALIDADPARGLTLQDVSDACGLSRFQALRGFAQRTGLTPHAYQILQRLRLSRRLLAAGEPLSHAALASGFVDQSHMNRCFVRAYGYTPGAYARAIRQDCNRIQDARG